MEDIMLARLTVGFVRTLTCIRTHSTPRSIHLCQRALSVPMANMSRRLDPQDSTLTGENTEPPSDSHPPQVEPFHHLRHTALSVPMAKRSRRLGPQETAVGGEIRTPPNDSHPPQLDPFHH